MGAVPTEEGFVFTDYLVAIVMFAVGGLIAFSLITTINHFDGSDVEKPRH